MRLILALSLSLCAVAQQAPPIPVDPPPLFGKTPAWRMLYMHDEDDAGLVINDFTVLSATHSVAAGYLEVKDKVKPVALVSNDGGKQWRRIELKDPALSLFFLDDTHGWVVTTKYLYVTEEGGLQWKRAGRLPPGMERVCFRTVLEGWTFGAGKTIYKTTDAGKTWVKVPESEALKLTPENTTFRWMAFSDEKKGLAIGNSQPKRPNQRNVPDWLYPEAALYRRQLPGTIALLETRDAGKTWEAQVSSIMGTVTRLRFAGEQGMAIFNYADEFEWPAEVIRLDLKARTNAPCFRRKDRLVTDVAYAKDGTIYLAAIEVGRVRSSPIPGKLRIIRTTDLKNWTEMAVDYRASGRRAFLSSFENSVWVATDDGMVLKLSE